MPDAGRACRHRARPCARRRGRHGRSRRGAAVRRRLGQLDRAGAGLTLAEKQDGDARAAAQRRQHRRDQHGAQTSFAHQRRPAGAAAPIPRGRRRSRFPTCPATILPSSAPGRPCPIRPRSPTRAPSSANTGSRLPEAATRALDDPNNESPKPGDKVFRRRRLSRSSPGRPMRSPPQRRAPRRPATQCVVLGDRLQGEAREVAAEHAASPANYAAQGRRIAILSGGELTVTLRGQGRGGPNQEYALALAIALAAPRALPRWPPIPTAPTAAAAAPTTRPGLLSSDTTLRARPGGWPRSRRVSCRQRFYGVFQCHRRPVSARPDVHQRDRLPRHRR